MDMMKQMGDIESKEAAQTTSTNTGNPQLDAINMMKQIMAGGGGPPGGMPPQGMPGMMPGNARGGRSNQQRRGGRR